MKIVTIWNTYGAYHLARVEALQRAFTEAQVVCFSHCRSHSESYPFFNVTHSLHEVLVDVDARELTFYRSFISALRRIFFHKPDLVLACGYERPETLAAAIYSRASGKPLFLMMENQYEDRPRRWFVEFVKTAYLKLFFQGFVYPGNTHRRYLERLGVPPNLLVGSYSCVDNTRIARMADALRSNGARLVGAPRYFLCVARLVEKKNIRGLLHAYLLYKRGLPAGQTPVALAICGDGPLRTELERAIDELDLRSSVLMLGREDRFERVVNYLTFAEALILPSIHSEQWGLVVNEAMAAGIPVVVSQQCGCCDVLVEHGVNGFRFDARSPEGLSEHLQWLHDHGDRLPAMGEASRRIVAAVTPDKFAANVKSLYYGAAGP